MTHVWPPCAEPDSLGDVRILRFHSGAQLLRQPCLAIATSIALAMCLTACHSPFEDYGASEILQRSVSDAISRELLDVDQSEGLVLTTQPPNQIAEALKNRIEVVFFF